MRKWLEFFLLHFTQKNNKNSKAKVSKKWDVWKTGNHYKYIHRKEMNASPQAIAISLNIKIFCLLFALTLLFANTRNNFSLFPLFPLLKKKNTKTETNKIINEMNLFSQVCWKKTNIWILIIAWCCLCWTLDHLHRHTLSFSVASEHIPTIKHTLCERRANKIASTTWFPTSLTGPTVSEYDERKKMRDFFLFGRRNCFMEWQNHLAKLRISLHK